VQEAEDAYPTPDAGGSKIIANKILGVRDSQLIQEPSLHLVDAPDLCWHGQDECAIVILRNTPQVGFVLVEHGLERIHILQSQQRSDLGSSFGKDAPNAFRHGEFTIDQRPESFEGFTFAEPGVHYSEKLFRGIERHLIATSPCVRPLLDLTQFSHE